jgi:hypothetical protein
MRILMLLLLLQSSEHAALDRLHVLSVIPALYVRCWLWCSVEYGMHAAA